MPAPAYSKALAAAIIAAAFAVSRPAAAEPGHWSKVAKATIVIVDEAEALAAAGKTTDAKRRITEAYFGPFESDKLEAALRKEVGAKHATLREKQFGDLRKLYGKNAPAAETKAIADALKAGLVEDGQFLDKAGVPPEVFAVNQ